MFKNLKLELLLRTNLGLHLEDWINGMTWQKKVHICIHTFTTKCLELEAIGIRRKHWKVKKDRKYKVAGRKTTVLLKFKNFYVWAFFIVQARWRSEWTCSMMFCRIIYSNIYQVVMMIWSLFLIQLFDNAATELSKLT